MAVPGMRAACPTCGWSEAVSDPMSVSARATEHYSTCEQQRKVNREVFERGEKYRKPKRSEFYDRGERGGGDSSWAN